MTTPSPANPSVSAAAASAPGGPAAPSQPDQQPTKPRLNPTATKLIDRLTSLADGASVESRQTIASWMNFNRRHAAHLASAVSSLVFPDGEDDAGGKATTTSATLPVGRILLYVRVIHEALVMGHGTDETKWDRCAALRSTLGEEAVMPAVRALQRRVGSAESEAAKAALEEVRTMVSRWEEVDAFGGPTILDEIRREIDRAPSAQDVGTDSSAPPSGTPDTEDATALAGASSEAAATSASVAAAADEQKATASTQSPSVAEETAEVTAAVDADVDTEREDGQSAANKSADAAAQDKEGGVDDGAEGSGDDDDAEDHAEDDDAVDFEAEGVEEGKVEPREFLAHTRDVASIQISRELGNDATVQLSTLLSTLPSEVEAACREAQSGGSSAAKPKLDELPGIPDDILDIDLNEAMANVRAYRDTVRKQRDARQAIVQLLLRSRCHFGSDEAAASFHKMADTIECLKKRKVMLSDAMELEGLDMEEEQEESNEAAEEVLRPLEWYRPSTPGAEAGDSGTEEDRDVKKARVGA